LINLTEFDFHVYDANHHRIERDVTDLTPPWWSVWFSHLWTAIVQSGGDANAAHHLHEWILNHPMFEDVVYRDVWVPAVPAPRDTSNDSEEVRQMEEKLSDDCYVSVASIDFLSTLTFFTRLSFVLAGLSFWDMVFHQKPLA
jgi:hypothetical protein